MIIDDNPLREGSEIATDVAIVGGGPAGISLALRLANKPGIDVVLLESGGLKFDEATQELARGWTVGQPYYPLHETRIRMLGGSSQSWGGVCTAFDASAMEPRPWVPDGAWPFPGDTLDPFLEDALAICGISPETRRIDEAAHAARVRGWPVERDVVTPVLVHFSRPLRFGSAHRAALAAARNVRVYLHRTAVELEAAPDGRAVDRVVLVAPGGGQTRVRARVFVLAAGGIENPRLLLASNRIHPAGLGNAYDRVGRYFMEHPRVATRYRVRRGNTPLARLVGGGAAGTLRFLRVEIVPEVQRREELLAWHGNLQSGYAGQLGPTWLSVRRIAIALRTPWRESPYFQDGGGGRSRLDSADLAAVMRRPDRAALSAIGALADPPALRRYLQITASTEQVPDPENRVDLAEDRDSLGVLRARINWRVSGDEERTYRRGIELLLRSLETIEPGISGAALDPDDPWPGDIVGTWHHLGTTRMSASPRTGVVDADGRVHDVENLFVAGGSVFPVSGSTAPTVPIVQLALRLGDHLVTRLNVSARVVGSTG